MPIIYTHSIDYFEAGYMLFKRKKRRHLPTINVKQDAFLLINYVRLIHYFEANRIYFTSKSSINFVLNNHSLPIKDTQKI